MAFFVGQVDAKVGADTGPFNRSMKQVHKKGLAVASGITNSFRRVGQRMQSIGMTMSAAITAPLIGAGTLAVKTAADYERLQIQLNTLAGSAEEGARAFKRLQNFSAGTPFQLNDLIQANNIIVGMGRSMDEAFKDMQMLGDVASATGANINELARTFGQAAAEGKLMTRDIREFINRGIPLTKLLAESMGVATSEVFDLASQGKITFDVLVKSLQDATTGTGLYANATEDAANTIHGVFSTLKDNTNRLLSEIGNSIVDTFDLKGVMKNLTASIQGIIDRFNKLSKESKKEILVVATALVAGGPLLVALGIAAKAVAGFASLVTSKFALIAGAVGIAVVAGQNLADNWSSILSEMGRQTASWAAATKNTLAFIAKTSSFFGRSMPGAMQGYFVAMDEAIITLQNFDNNAEPSFVSFSESAQNAFGNVSSAIRSMLNTLSGGSLEDFLALLNGGLGNTSTGGISSPMENIIPADLNPEIEGLSQKIQEFEGFAVEAGEKGEVAMDRLGMGVSNIVGQLVRGQKEALSFGNIFQTLLPGVLAAIPGIGGGAFFSRVFGGIFHSGGMIPGSGDKMIKAKGGEMVLTKSQQGALAGLIHSGGSVSENAMAKAFEKALGKHLQKLSPQEIYAMNRKGQVGF